MKKKKITKPKHLAPSAAQAWDELVAELDAAGTLEQADRALITLAAELTGIKDDAYAEIQKTGPVIKQPNGWPGPTPYLAIYTKHAAALRAVLENLGLSPAQRAKMKPTTEVEPLAELKF